MALKKGEIYTGYVDSIGFPNKGNIWVTDEEGERHKVTVKNALPGQKVSFRLTKKKSGNSEGLLKEVLEKSEYETETVCRNAGKCGGCLYPGFSYDKTLEIKEAQVKKLLENYLSDDVIYDGIKGSPLCNGYRGKMEYTFGDEYRDGPKVLGLHKRGGFYDIVDASDCRIADEDYGKLVSHTSRFFAGRGVEFYHRMKHTGVLRHLLVRKATKTGELMAALVTVSGNDKTSGLDAEQIDSLCNEWKDSLLSLEFKGTLTGVLHIVNDSQADAIICDKMDVLWGKDWFTEELLGLKFKITPFSFFQTNSRGAEVLYSLVRTYIKEDVKGGKVFDLYSGTGTIAQILAPSAGKVTGVEIVEEAVEAAKENAKLNGLDNCDFIAGDVFKVLESYADSLDSPDCIILDPPRDGVGAKALPRILNYGVDHIVYVSCKPTSLARDMEIIEAKGYRISRWGMVDMFPFTGNIEVCCLLERLRSAKDNIEISIDADDYYRIKDNK